jgi:hypothetical protein
VFPGEVYRRRGRASWSSSASPLHALGRVDVVELDGIVVFDDTALPWVYRERS